MKLLICTQAVDSKHPILGFFHGWIEEFAKHFDEVHVICLQKGEYNFPPHVFVYSMGKETGENKFKYLFRFYTYFTKIFFAVKVQYVFFHMGAIYNILASPFFLLRFLYKTSFYWWKAHGHINVLGRLALLFVDRVYTSTESGFDIETTKRRVVGQAIPTNLFVLPESGAERKKEIIFVGRIMPVKHIEDFITSAKVINTFDSSFVFRIYGPIGDEVYYKKMSDLIVSLGLQNTVFFMGAKKQEELVSIYQQVSYFLNTSLTQSMDKTVLEAMLCGCIPITSNRAFEALLLKYGLYAAGATADLYAEVIKELPERATDTLRDLLRKEVVAQHSLDTFAHRIFAV